MTTQANIDDQNYYRSTKRISWSAILAGALVGVGLSFLLNLFGVAIGLSAFSMSESGAASLAVGGLLGLIISTIVAMYFAGLTSGYLGRLYVPKRNMGIVYGFTTWSVSLILTVVLTAHIGSYIDSYSTTVTRNSVVVSQVKAEPAKTSHISDEQKQKIETVTPKQATGGMAVGAFIVFALFFVGAFASCVGAHHGMGCRGKE